LYVNDFSSLVLTPLLLALLTIGRPRLSPIRRRLVVFCALLFFAVPVLFQIVGHFAF
jgi:hypothetical protein